MPKGWHTVPSEANLSLFGSTESLGGGMLIRAKKLATVVAHYSVGALYVMGQLVSYGVRAEKDPS